MWCSCPFPATFLLSTATRWLRCSTLQRTATYTATQCKSRRRTATHWSTLWVVSWVLRQDGWGATHGNSLTCTTSHCNALQLSAVLTSVSGNFLLKFCDKMARCNTLQCNAAHWKTRSNTLQQTATHCNTLRLVFLSTATTWLRCITLQRTATHCNALQRTATHCNARQHTQQHITTYCNTLRHTAQLCAFFLEYCYTMAEIKYTATHCSTLSNTL